MDMITRKRYGKANVTLFYHFRVSSRVRLRKALENLRRLSEYRRVENVQSGECLLDLSLMC